MERQSALRFDGDGKAGDDATARETGESNFRMRGANGTSSSFPPFRTPAPNQDSTASQNWFERVRRASRPAPGRLTAGNALENSGNYGARPQSAGFEARKAVEISCQRAKFLVGTSHKLKYNQPRCSDWTGVIFLEIQTAKISERHPAQSCAGKQSMGLGVPIPGPQHRYPKIHVHQHRKVSHAGGS